MKGAAPYRALDVQSVVTNIVGVLYHHKGGRNIVYDRPPYSKKTDTKRASLAKNQTRGRSLAPSDYENHSFDLDQGVVLNAETSALVTAVFSAVSSPVPSELVTEGLTKNKPAFLVTYGASLQRKNNFNTLKLF